MTKDELLSFINFNNEQEKEDAEFYISVKGVALHCRVLDFLGFSFSASAGEKVEWHKVSQLLKTDKATRDVIYIYLATLEEYIRAFISNKYENDLQQKFWINGQGTRNCIKDNIEHGKELFEVLQNTEFGCLMQQVEKLPLEDKKQLFGVSYCKKNLDAVKELRNAVSHHVFLASYKFKNCIVDGFEGCSLIDNIKNLRQLLPKRYRYGKNGKGGITAQLRKCGIKLD